MKLTGGEIILEYLIRERVPFVAGIPGHGSLGLADAFKGRERRIRPVQVRQEMCGVHMADGYYRVTGQPAAVFTSIGPGAINTAIGLATAYVDSTAVLAFTGDTHTHMMGKGVLQEIERRRDSDFSSVMAPITKRHWLVTETGQLPSILHRAFNQMLTGRPGPVLISLPMNVQCDSVNVELPEPVRHKPRGVPAGDPVEIEKAARLLLKARRPVILAGGGVHTAGAWKELRQLAERLGAGVVTTLPGKSAFPEDHPLACWLTGAKGTTCGVRIATRADVMLSVGCRFADETASSYKPGAALRIPPTKLIQVDVDGQEIGKNYPVEVGIIGDARAVLQGILDCLKTSRRPRDYRNTAYFREIQRARAAWARRTERWADDSREPMMISSLLREVRRVLKRDAIVGTSSGNTQAQVLQEFPFYVPRTNLTTGGFSTMGFTLPACLGAKLAYPGRQVVGIVGDGDFMMTMQELATAVQLNLPIVMVVANNCGWISIKDLQMTAYGKDRAVAVDFVDGRGRPYTPHFANIAREFGCFGERVTHAGEVASALQRALRSGKPAVLEAMVNREYPYTGSPAVGWWDVPVPTYLGARRRRYERGRTKERLG